MERYLKNDDSLQMNDGGKYVISEMIGRGSSCAVYRAEYIDADGIRTEHLLKEYNPKNITVTRKDDGTIHVASDEQDGFAAGLTRFQAGYEKQLSIRRMSELRNCTSNVQTVFEANGTRYIDMTLFTGSTYSEIREQSLYDLCRRMKAVAQVVRNYHKAGFLHLDIKPENIFAIPETCELVMLFDFDSVVEKEFIGRGAGLSYTKTWAAPEQLNAARRKDICEATDLYAIGEMFFWQIFGRHSTTEEHRSFFAYQFDPEAGIFKNVNPQVFPLLSELLHHTIATSVQNRFSSANELISALNELIQLSDPKTPYLVTTRVVPEDFFIGRDNELQQMHEMLSEKPTLFLCGMGGIGKSELARNYVKRYGNDYDTIFFATYMSSWSMLLTDDYRIQIANFHSYEGEKPEDYFARKIRKLKELCNESTLFVIDNVNEDEFKGSESECFRQIMALPCRFLFTSRLHEWNYPLLEVGELAERSDLVALFDQWCPIKDTTQMNAVGEIIDYVDSHTLTLELIAKQTTASFSTPEKMLVKLKEHGMRDSGKEKVKLNKDHAASKKTAFEHICALFDLSLLTDNQKGVMVFLSMLPPHGIQIVTFRTLCDLHDLNEINELIERSWIIREDSKIRMHPLIAEVCLKYLSDANCDCTNSNAILDAIDLYLTQMKAFFEQVNCIQEDSVLWGFDYIQIASHFLNLKENCLMILESYHSLLSLMSGAFYHAKQFDLQKRAIELAFDSAVMVNACQSDLVDCKFNLAIANQAVGSEKNDMSMQLDSIKQMEEILTELNPNDGDYLATMLIVLSHIANSYYEIGDTEKAISKYRQAMDSVEPTDDLTEDEAINLAIIYDHAARLEHDPILIKLYFDQAIALHRQWPLTYYYREPR